MKKVLLMAIAGLTSVTASAQYPDLTDEAKQLIAEQKAQWKAHADSVGNLISLWAKRAHPKFLCLTATTISSSKYPGIPEAAT